MARSGDVAELLEALEGVERLRLVALSDRGRGLVHAPSFRARCLDAAYLEAVARGTWSLDDEALLAQACERMEVLSLPRVRVLDRRSLKAVLHATLLAVMTADLGVPTWEPRRAELARAWEDVVGPLPGRRLVAGEA